MRKIANPQQLQDQLRRLIAMCQGPERPHRQQLAREMRRLASQLVDGGTSKRAGITDYDTLSQIFDMEIESLGGDSGVDLPSGVWSSIEKAAEGYESAIEKALLEWVKNNMEKLRIGEKALRTVQRPQDVVDVMMELRGGAGYLYFMEAEGHGVGTWDGDWDILFKDHRTTIRELSKFIENKTRNAYRKLKDALTNGAFESMPEGESDD